MKWALAILLTSLGLLAKDRTASPFTAGNTAFHAGEFEAAITNYQTQVDSGLVSAPLFFNLANAAYRTNRLGLAIYNYRRAAELAPRDADIARNLAMARDAVHNGSPPKAGVIDRLTGFFTRNEWALLAGVPLTLWLVWLAVIHISPSCEPWMGLARPVLGTLALLLLCLATLAHDRQSDTRWVVVQKETAARFGPVAQAPDKFKWFDGAELRVNQVRDGWVEATDATDRTGWVSTEAVLHAGLKAPSRAFPVVLGLVGLGLIAAWGTRRLLRY